MWDYKCWGCGSWYIGVVLIDDLVVDGGADMIGLIFAEKSKRRVSPSTGSEIVSTLRAKFPRADDRDHIAPFDDRSNTGTAEWYINSN
jgi:hypothetical protein